MLAALAPQTQHLILIGDHEQLRPKTEMYELRVRPTCHPTWTQQQMLYMQVNSWRMHSSSRWSRYVCGGRRPNHGRSSIWTSPALRGLYAPAASPSQPCRSSAGCAHPSPGSSVTIYPKLQVCGPLLMHRSVDSQLFYIWKEHQQHVSPFFRRCLSHH